MTEHVDCVIIGSGFGGSVATYRMAEAGLSTVVLERGQAFPPGSFARSPAEMGRAFWDPAAGLHGIFDVWRFSGCDSIVSSGLGGGSLIYANVLLRKDEHWFVNDQPLPGAAGGGRRAGGRERGHESWPVTRADLDPHYDEVERMIGAMPYPLDKPGFTNSPKTHAMQDAAAELGLDWRLPPLAISFAPSPGAEPAIGLPIVEPEGNLHGVPRSTCRLCSECDIGCNDGAKNSLDFTYLSAARRKGADLRTMHEARAIRPRPGGGYAVDYVRHDPATEGRRTRTASLPAQTITCDRLILAAGTYGTTYLLLRSRDLYPEAFAGLSPALGTRFCGNGDLLTFLTGAKDRGRTRPLDASRGPVITSAIRLPDEADGLPGTTGSGLRGAYIQDGGYPGFVDWIVEAADIGDEIARTVRFAFDRFIDFLRATPDTNLSAELSDLIGDGSLSISSLPLLGMGRDVPDGVLRLKDDRLHADWTSETSMAYFERVRTTMRRIADVLGAEYQDNPIWFRKRVVTVHPMGGAPMAHDPQRGVCDGHGQVHGFPGLFIADAAAMPGPVGPNPALTIAALADRMCTRVLESGSTVRAGNKTEHPAWRGAGTSPGAGGEVMAGPDAGRAGSGSGSGSGNKVERATGNRAERLAGNRIADPSGAQVRGPGPDGTGTNAGPETGSVARLKADAGTGAGPVSTGPPLGDPPGRGDIGGMNGTTCGSPQRPSERPGGPVAGRGRPRRGEVRTSLSFTEEMKGFYTAGAGNPGLSVPAARSELSFRLTITMDDVDRFLAEPDHLARADGWIDSPMCGGRRPVEAGWFNLFAPSGSPDRRLMRYRLHLTDDAGRPRTLSGWKNVQHGPVTDIWPDTSTLFFRLLDGHIAEGEDDHARVVGAGTLRIELDDFVRQLTTFRTDGPDGLTALARFGTFFVGRLWEVYGPRRAARPDGLDRADRLDSPDRPDRSDRSESLS